MCSLEERGNSTSADDVCVCENRENQKSRALRSSAQRTFARSRENEEGGGQILNRMMEGPR